MVAALAARKHPTPRLLRSLASTSPRSQARGYQGLGLPGLGAAAWRPRLAPVELLRCADELERMPAIGFVVARVEDQPKRRAPWSTEPGSSLAPRFDCRFILTSVAVCVCRQDPAVSRRFRLPASSAVKSTSPAGTRRCDPLTAPVHDPLCQARVRRSAGRFYCVLRTRTVSGRLGLAVDDDLTVRHVHRDFGGHLNAR